MGGRVSTPGAHVLRGAPPSSRVQMPPPRRSAPHTLAHGLHEQLSELRLLHGGAGQPLLRHLIKEPAGKLQVWPRLRPQAGLNRIHEAAQRGRQADVLRGGTRRGHRGRVCSLPEGGAPSAANESQGWTGTAADCPWRTFIW